MDINDFLILATLFSFLIFFFSLLHLSCSFYVLSSFFFFATTLEHRGSESG